MIGVGDAAPGFVLAAAPGEMVDLSDHLGTDRIVLLFYPLAFSGVCTSELCSIRDAWHRYEELDVRLFGVSVDSLFATSRFRESEGLPFPLLSDFNRDVAESYGVLETNAFGMIGIAKRSVFVIGSDGVVHYAWVSDDDGVEPDYDEILEAVASAP
ncbi:MAG: redoxin domain-containing protein [Gemmatimonadota bacterium]|nr:redoxin domain-containing protein [Gemmatimonadota bacterium]